MTKKKKKKKNNPAKLNSPPPTLPLCREPRVGEGTLPSPPTLQCQKHFIVKGEDRAQGRYSHFSGSRSKSENAKERNEGEMTGM